MILSSAFNAKVRICVSEKSDGNMRVFSEKETKEVLASQTKVAEKLDLSADETMLLKCTYDRSDFTRYVFNPDLVEFSIKNTSAVPICDGILIDQSNIGILLPLADCLGVVLHDATKNLLMLVHCGRHNLEQEGLSKAVEFMINFGATPDSIRAIFSPYAKSYAIHNMNNQGLGEVARRQLSSKGVNPKNIADEFPDTVTSENFFSHSRGDKTARFAFAAKQ